MELISLREVFSKYVEKILSRIKKERTSQVLEELLVLLGIIIGLTEVLFFLGFYFFVSGKHLCCGIRLHERVI
jgi:hypothetical protein